MIKTLERVSKHYYYIIRGDDKKEYANCGDNNYELAECVVFHNPQYKDNIDDVFTILQLMSKYKLFEVHTDVEEVVLDDGKVYQNIEYSFIFHTD